MSASPSVRDSWSQHQHQHQHQDQDQQIWIDAVHRFGDEISSAPNSDQDGMFWQFPCRTEASAFFQHRQLQRSRRETDTLELYFGFPWATYIDMLIKETWSESGRATHNRTLRSIQRRIARIRFELATQRRSLRLHTVCQHVQWGRAIEVLEHLGITDLWLSHCPHVTASASGSPLQLHAWSLFAVNAEDPVRRAGLTVGRPVEERSLLASFIGARMNHYVDDTRQRLEILVGTPGLVIRFTDEWHFEQIVYRQQIAGTSVATTTTDDSVLEYNSVLSDSVFALCPAGAGHNTLRFWEALATGAIPVVFDPGPKLPNEGVAASIDWDRIVVRVSPEQIPELPRLLGGISIYERRERQSRGMQAYALVRSMTCFPTEA